MIRLAHPVLGSLAVLLLFVLPIRSLDSSSRTSKLSYLGNNRFTCTSEDLIIENLSLIKTEVRHTPDVFVLTLWLDNLGNKLTFVLKEEEISETSYELDHSQKRYVTFQFQGESCMYEADELHGGLFTIHHYNPTKKIIAGSFEFVAYSTGCDKLIRLNNGLFDATFVSL